MAEYLEQMVNGADGKGYDQDARGMDGKVLAMRAGGMGEKTCDRCAYRMENGKCMHPLYFGHKAEGQTGCFAWEERKEGAMTPIVGETTLAMQTLEVIPKLQEGISALADMLRITNERMQALEAAVRTLEKLTPQQAKKMNKAIRERAREICEEWRMQGKEKAIGAGIRKTVSEMTGARTIREIARCDFDSVMELVIDWEDWDTIQTVRKGKEGK